MNKWSSILRPGLWVTFFLLGTTVFFSWNLSRLDLSLTDPEFFHYYPALREWFLSRLLAGKFPAWNPYWGIGHATEVATTLPIDIFSIPEAFGFGISTLRPLQFFSVLLCAFIGLRLLSLSHSQAALGAVAFIFSPWALYQFFFFPSVNAYLGLLLCAPLTYRWIIREERKIWFALALCFFLLSFGTRPEHWRFNLTFLTLLAALSAMATAKYKALGGFALAIGLATAGHAWQWVPLLQIAQESGGSGGGGFGVFLHSEVYTKLLLSLWDSVLPKITALSLSLWLLTNSALLPQALGCLGVVLLFFPAQLLLLATPFGAGASLGFLTWLFFVKPRRMEQVKVFALFLPLTYYWIRPGQTETREIAVMLIAPVLLKALFGFLAWFAATAARYSRPGRIFYAVLVVLFFVRDQGQIISIYAFGTPWIPTHDNYLFDFTLAVLSGLGLGLLPARASRLSFVALAWALVAVAPNKFYSLPSKKLDPQSLSHYSRLPGGEAALQALRDSPTWRGYFTRPGGLETSSLRLSANEITLQSSSTPRRFRDWAIFHRLGIPPHYKWSSYPYGYTEETLAKFPKKEFFVYSNDVANWWGHHVWLPNNANLFRLLGVSHILSGEPIPPSTDFTDHRKNGEYFSARVTYPLPRAFLVPDMDEQGRVAFGQDLTPLVGAQKIRAGGQVMPFRPATIRSYEPEKVVIDTEGEGKTILVLTDLLHPFWTVKIDGESALIFPALYLFRGVPLPAGKHTVTFECRIPFFLWGVGISCLALALILMRGLGLRLPRALRSRLGKRPSFADPLGAYRNAESSTA